MPMDFMDISKMRITVRKYDPRPVEKDKIDRILEAGRWAPTAVDYQPQRILVMDRPEHFLKIREFCTFGFDQKYRDIDENAGLHGDESHNVYYYGAPLVFLVCYDRNVCWQHPESGESSGLIDATIVQTHMMLEAASLGLGTVWISYFDKKKARELLQIPEHFEIAGMLYAGYPAADFKPNRKLSGKRYPVSHTCFDGSFDSPYETSYKDTFKDPRLEEEK